LALSPIFLLCCVVIFFPPELCLLLTRDGFSLSVAKNSAHEAGLDVASLSMTTASIVNRTQEKNQVHADLLAARGVHEEHANRLDKREGRLQAARAEYEDHKAKFEVFTQENEEKYQAAKTRSEQHNLETEALEREIEQLRFQLEELREKKRLAIQDLADVGRHRDYLLSVASLASDQYRGIEDITARHEMLTSVRHDVTRVLRQHEADIAEAKRDIERMSVLRKNQNLVLQSEVQKLKDEYDALVGEVDQGELRNAEEHTGKLQRHADFGNAQLAIGNMYQQLRRAKPARNLTLVEKLEMIELEIARIADVLETEEQRR
jgi:Domain of unknown function (DUF4200)